MVFIFYLNYCKSSLNAKNKNNITFTLEALRWTINGYTKYMLYFLSFSIVKISSHSKNRFHFLCIQSLLFFSKLHLSKPTSKTTIYIFSTTPILTNINITDNLLVLISKIHINTILINIILIIIPKSFKFPLFIIGKCFLYRMHELYTDFRCIILAKKTYN